MSLMKTDSVDIRLYKNTLPLRNYEGKETYEETAQETKRYIDHPTDDVP